MEQEARGGSGGGEAEEGGGYTVLLVSIGHLGTNKNKYIYFTWSKIPSISM